MDPAPEIDRLWQASLEWDSNLPEDLDKLWGQFVKELPSIDKIMLPRHIDMRVYSKIELVGFSDASLRGYAAVVYLRVVDSSGHATVNFVTCKTKVAPIKTTKCQTTVPRLELCAALLLATTLNRVKTCLDIDISNIYAWTDSTVVLSWLTVSQKSFKCDDIENQEHSDNPSTQVEIGALRRLLHVIHGDHHVRGKHERLLKKWRMC
ncbi:uncharacterized protein LOC126843998 [Adelges cooleyi]|uniref:uncharacterized protein LOC126843998 n=1 Tax=Adelges cooleyi TaxID=133065 RepID=UPI00217F7292|nr:uncharacterized protein LOC126843998 [Adelges cooleyi]